MADNRLELVVEVDVNKANASIKTVKSGLTSIEHTAAKSARGAAQGIDGMTAAMVKGATAGNLFADAIKSALNWAKDFTVGSVMMAAENAKAEASLKALATAHGVDPAAATRQVAAIEEIGFEFTEAAHAVQRLIVADMDLSKAEGLAKLAKNAAAVQNVSAGEAMEAIVLAIESGASRGLRTLGLFVDFQKEAQITQLQLGRSLTETEEKQLEARRRRRSVRRPRARKCLLKGCEQWFRPRHARQRYCGEACQKQARKWAERKAWRVWRATAAGKQKRNGQSQRYRERLKTRKPSEKEAVWEPARVIAKNFFRRLLRPAGLLRVLPALTAIAVATVLLACLPARDGARLGTRAALAAETRPVPPFSWQAAVCAAAMKPRDELAILIGPSAALTFSLCCAGPMKMC